MCIVLLWRMERRAIYFMLSYNCSWGLNFLILICIWIKSFLAKISVNRLKTFNQSAQFFIKLIERFLPSLEVWIIFLYCFWTSFARWLCLAPEMLRFVMIVLFFVFLIIVVRFYRNFFFLRMLLTRFPLAFISGEWFWGIVYKWFVLLNDLSLCC